MAALTTYEAELFGTVHAILGHAKDITVNEVQTAQDAMLNLRIDWESLESCLRSRKIDGFEPAVLAMRKLAATALSMASVMQAKIVNQRIRQMEQEDRDEIAEELAARNIAKDKQAPQKKPTKRRRGVKI